MRQLMKHVGKRLGVHQTVLDGDVEDVGVATPLGAFAPGQLCRIVADRGKFLGFGYINPHSLICARILGRDPQHPPGKSLIVHRLQVAQSLRRALYDRPFYRLAYGESDALPGLVLDRFGDIDAHMRGYATDPDGSLYSIYNDGRVNAQL